MFRRTALAVLALLCPLAVAANQNLPHPPHPLASASQITFDNTTSGLNCDDVQECIDELESLVGGPGGGLDFDVIGTGTNTTATMTVGAGGSIVTASTGSNQATVLGIASTPQVRKVASTWFVDANGDGARDNGEYSITNKTWFFAEDYAGGGAVTNVAIEAALAAIGTVGGSNFNGAHIWLPEGVINVGDNITVGDCAVTANEQRGITISGMGGGAGGVSQNATLLTWSGASEAGAGTGVIELCGVGHRVMDLGITAGGVVDYGVLIKGNTDDVPGLAQTSFGSLERLQISSADRAAIGVIDISGAASPQNAVVDQFSFRDIRIGKDTADATDLDYCVEINVNQTSLLKFDHITCGQFGVHGFHITTGSAEIYESTISTNTTDCDTDANCYAVFVASTALAPRVVIEDVHSEMYVGNGYQLSDGGGAAMVDVRGGSLLLGEAANRIAVKWDGTGSLNFDNVLLTDGGSPTQTHLVDIDCDASDCTNADDEHRLHLRWNVVDRISTGAGSLSIDIDRTDAIRPVDGELLGNELRDVDGDGAFDFAVVGDWDFDGTLEIFDDIDAAVQVLTDTGPKLLRVRPGTFVMPALALCDAVGDVPCGARLQALVDPGEANATAWGGVISLRGVDHFTLEGAGPDSTILQMLPYSASGSPTDPEHVQVVEISNSDFVTVKGFSFYGGGSAAYTTASSCGGSPCTGIVKRAVQIYNSDFVTMEDNYCRYFHHACGFVEASRDVTIRNNVGYRNGGYNDAAAQGQATFYVYTDGGMPNTERVRFEGNTAYDPSIGFNLRLGPGATGAESVSDVELFGNAVYGDGTDVCVQVRGQTRTRIKDIHCDGTQGIVFTAGAAYREAGDHDTSKDVLIDGATFANSTVSSGSPLTIAAYSEQVVVRNVSVTNNVSAVNANCMWVQAPIRGFVLDGFHFSRCGTGSSAAIVFSDSDGWGNKPDDSVIVRNGEIFDVDRLLSDNATSIMSGILFSSGTVKNSTFENISIRGITNMAISVPSGVTIARNRFSHITADGVPPRYLGRFTVAGAPTCNAARAEYIATLSSATSCTAGGGGSIFKCYCNGSAWTSYTNGQTHPVNFQSASGIDDNLFENFAISNADAQDGVRFGGAGTDDHVGNVLRNFVVYQDSDFVINNMSDGIEFSTGVGTNNLVTGLKVPTANPATPLNPGTGSTWVPTETISKSILSPDGTEDHLIEKMRSMCVVTDADCITEGTTPTLNWTPRESNATGGSPVDIEAVIACDSDGATEASGIDNQVLDAGDWLRFEYDTPGGTLTSVTSTLGLMCPMAQ